MPRFVILTHDHPFPHWDLMLETGGVLRTWRLLEEPAPGAAVRAERLADHRTMYLDYEGPLSGDRGHVVRWDAGTFEAEIDDREPLRVVLSGERLKLTAELCQEPPGELVWVFCDVPP